MMDSLVAMMQAELVLDLLRATLTIAAGFILAQLVGQGVRKLTLRHFTPHQSMLINRVLYWLILGLFFTSALRQLGFSLSVVLGAAGILSVAIGFASQTSASNLISGLFLVSEKPFQLGDVIKVGDTTGEVLSVDLLSVKLRTFDNLFVRIPNESLIKSQVTNMTRFPIRRFDLQIGVAYREEISKVREVLARVAEQNPLCLDEPEPLFMFTGFGESSLNIQFSVWAKRESFLNLRNTMQEQVKIAFDEAGIEIPFPHRSLYSGSKSAPFPIRIVAEGADTEVPEAEKQSADTPKQSS